MHRGHRLVFALIPWPLSRTAYAHPGALRAVDRVAIPAMCEHQLEVFRQDDTGAAFAVAGPAIQPKYATPEIFMTAVKTFYAAVYRPRRMRGFTDL
jgi:hypothetical protein